MYTYVKRKQPPRQPHLLMFVARVGHVGLMSGRKASPTHVCSEGGAGGCGMCGSGRMAPPTCVCSEGGGAASVAMGCVMSGRLAPPTHVCSEGGACVICRMSK